VFFVKVEQKEAQGIRDTILSKWSKMGLNITGFKAPVIVSNPSNPANIKGALMSAFSQAQTLFKKRCQLIVCILDPKFKGLYEQIKVMLLCQANIISQCMLSNHVTRGEIKDQYISNVGLKVNMKMGGTNNTADTTVLNNVPTMFMGADVTHASPNSDMPSVAAVVSSFDADATKYSTYCRAQGQRVEVIESIAEITTKALTQYKKMNQKLPKRIIMFRDGVSSGQFEEVLKVEVSALEKAAKKMKCNASITYVIVQKRHNVKFFPLDNNQDRSGNCLPGTVIDQDITHPTQFNFYLQSHSGLQGTSRPTLYHVIYDQNNFSSDELQKITYALCLLSERATRTISMVAPSYRAHFAAFCI
jgi:eukaryotic translation initiation factor 2C